MDKSLDDIDCLYITDDSFRVNYTHNTKETTIETVESNFSFKKIFEYNFTFQIITKGFFKNLGLSFNEDNILHFKGSMIIEKDSDKVHALVINDNILILGDFTWSDIHDSLSYIKLNSKLDKKHIYLKQKKI